MVLLPAAVVAGISYPKRESARPLAHPHPSLHSRLWQGTSETRLFDPGVSPSQLYQSFLHYLALKVRTDVDATRLLEANPTTVKIKSQKILIYHGLDSTIFRATTTAITTFTNELSKHYYKSIAEPRISPSQTYNTTYFFLKLFTSRPLPAFFTSQN